MGVNYLVRFFLLVRRSYISWMLSRKGWKLSHSLGWGCWVPLSARLWAHTDRRELTPGGMPSAAEPAQKSAHLNCLGFILLLLFRLSLWGNSSWTLPKDFVEGISRLMWVFCPGDVQMSFLIFRFSLEWVSTVGRWYSSRFWFSLLGFLTA